MPQKRLKFVFVLIALHLAIVLPLGYILNIWVDEASTLYTTEHGFFYAWQYALTDEKQAPFYFWILSLWREINSSILFARFFSVVCSVTAIKVFSDLARKLFSEKAAVYVTAFFALHPYLVWASLEIRVYSLVILLSVSLLNLFYDGYLQNAEEVETRKKQALYLLCAIVALYTNYYLGFLLVGCFAGLLAARRWRTARRFFLQMVLVGAAVAPLLWTIKSQLAVNTSGFHPDKTPSGGWQAIWSFLLTFILPTEIFPPEEATAISFFRLWLIRLAVIAVTILLLKNWRRLDEKILSFGAISLTIIGFLSLAYFLLGAMYVEIRHAAILFAPLILSIGLAVKAILPPRRAENVNVYSARKIIMAAALTIFVLIFFAYSTFSLYPNLTKRGDWARVGAFIEQNESANQPIIVFTTFDAVALPYNYHGVNPILPDEKFFIWEFEDEVGSANSWRRQTEFIISKIPPESSEIWLLTNEKCEKGQACEPLENFVQANYTVIEEKDFYKEKARLLRKKQND